MINRWPGGPKGLRDFGDKAQTLLTREIDGINLTSSKNVERRVYPGIEGALAEDNG